MHAMDHLTHMLNTVVLSWDTRSWWSFEIWTTDKGKRTLPRQCHVILCHFQITYIICLIVLCCYRRSLPPWYPLSNLKEITSLPPLKTFLIQGEFNWNMYEITLPYYVINICTLYHLYSKQHGFLKEEIMGYTHAHFHHATTFSCRYIAFQIWWLPCNPHRCEWPKTFWGGVGK